MAHLTRYGPPGRELQDGTVTLPPMRCTPGSQYVCLRLSSGAAAGAGAAGAAAGAAAEPDDAAAPAEPDEPDAGGVAEPAAGPVQLGEVCAVVVQSVSRSLRDHFECPPAHPQHRAALRRCAPRVLGRMWRSWDPVPAASQARLLQATEEAVDAVAAVAAAAAVAGEAAAAPQQAEAEAEAEAAAAAAEAEAAAAAAAAEVEAAAAPQQQAEEDGWLQLSPQAREQAEQRRAAAAALQALEDLEELVAALQEQPLCAGGALPEQLRPRARHGLDEWQQRVAPALVLHFGTLSDEHRAALRVRFVLSRLAGIRLEPIGTGPETERLFMQTCGARRRAVGQWAGGAALAAAAAAADDYYDDYDDDE